MAKTKKQKHMSAGQFVLDENKTNKQGYETKNVKKYKKNAEILR